MFFYLILSCANKKTDVCMKSSIVCIIGLTLFTLIADVVQASQEVVDAARAESLEEVRTLIESGADTNLPQGDGATALHWAVYWENSEMVDLLLAHNVDVDVANDLGVTPLFMACQAGNNSLVEKLLLAGADPNSSVPSGETPLMTASRAGSSMAVHQLLEHGARVNARESTRGQTALMWAVANKHSGVVAKLLENDADVHARSEVRTRVYNMGGSRSAGSASAGIPLKEVAIGGSTAILFAARSGDIRSAELLLNAGADALKVFPAEMIVPKVLKAWKAILPKETLLIPVGGILPNSMESYIFAGANGFGLGSALYRPGLAVEDVLANAEDFLKCLKNLKLSKVRN